jgi:two-component system sensor kinase FixL
MSHLPDQGASSPQTNSGPASNGSDGQEKFTALAATVDGIVVIHQQGRCRFANTAAEKILGYTQAEILQRNFWEFIHPEFQPLVQQRGLSREAGEQVPPQYEFPIIRNGGEVRWLDCSASRIVIDGAPAVLVSAVDITTRKRLEKEILAISDDARRHMGFELHDGFGQLLGGIALKAKLVERALSDEHNVHAKDAGEVVRLLHEAMRQLRSIVSGLDLAQLESSGLVQALRELLRETESLFHVKCLFESNCAHWPLKAEANAHLYRLAQEAISNSVRHGEAREVRVRLHLENHVLCLSIQDDGKGFPIKTLSRQGMGLRSMELRTNACGGKLTIESSAQIGTTVTCAVPLASPAG